MIAAIIPAYNEGAVIGALLESLAPALEALDADWRIAVVNDGSTDETEKIVREKAFGGRVTCLVHPVSRGVDEAFRTGFKWALEVASDDAFLLTLEGDGTSELALLRKLKSLLDEGADVAAASCFGPGGKVVGDPPLRWLMSRSVNLLLKILYPVKGLHTYTSFYRMHRVQAVRRCFARFGERTLEDRGFVCMAGFLLKLRRCGAVIREAPFVMISREDPMKSNMRIGRTIWGYVRLIAGNPPGF